MTYMKIRAMKRFVRWLDQNNVHAELRETFFLRPWIMWPKERQGIERRLDETAARDAFCEDRSKKRKSWKSTYLRSSQYDKALQLITYITNRHKRRATMTKTKDKTRTEDKPEAGKVYALTGGPGSRCIANGNTWVESEVDQQELLVKPSLEKLK